MADLGGFRMTDTFLVARASCGCVESVLLPTDNDADRATFLLHFPHATPQTVWPIVRCDEHPPPHPNPLLDGAA